MTNESSNHTLADTSFMNVSLAGMCPHIYYPVASLTDIWLLRGVFFRALVLKIYSSPASKIAWLITQRIETNNELYLVFFGAPKEGIFSDGGGGQWGGGPRPEGSLRRDTERPTGCNAWFTLWRWKIINNWVIHSRKFKNFNSTIKKKHNERKTFLISAAKYQCHQWTGYFTQLLTQ